MLFCWRRAPEPARASGGGGEQTSEKPTGHNVVMEVVMVVVVSRVVWRVVW